MGYRGCGLWFMVGRLRVPGFGSRVSGFGFRMSGAGCRVWAGSGYRVSDFGYRVSGFGHRVLGFGFRVDGCAREPGRRLAIPLHCRWPHPRASHPAPESQFQRRDRLLVRRVSKQHPTLATPGPATIRPVGGCIQG